MYHNNKIRLGIRPQVVQRDSRHWVTTMCAVRAAGKYVFFFRANNNCELHYTEQTDYS